MGIGPKLVHPTAQLRTPLLLIGRSRLIEPPQVGPPKATLLWAGDIFGRIRVGVMMAMIGYPTRRRTAAVDHCPEDQEVLDELIELECSVREQAMITDSYAEASESRKKKGKAENLGTRQREQKQADDSQEMNQSKIEENRAFPRGRFPKRPFPRPNPLERSFAHGWLLRINFFPWTSDSAATGFATIDGKASPAAYASGSAGLAEPLATLFASIRLCIGATDRSDLDCLDIPARGPCDKGDLKWSGSLRFCSSR